MNYIHTVGLVTDDAILWVCFICGLIPGFFLHFCSLLITPYADIFPFFYVSDIMAVPPAYSDLGKAAKDIFSKGYGEESHSVLEKLFAFKDKLHSTLFNVFVLFVGFGIVKLDLKTKSQNGVVS